jgi:hypothetical protein
MAKLLNVAMILGALELLVLVDDYRMKKKEVGGDIHLQAYARINVKQVLSKVLAAGTHGGLLPEVLPEEDEIHTYILSQASCLMCSLLVRCTDDVVQGVDVKNLYVLGQCCKDLDLVVDLRKMCNKKKQGTVSSTMVHPESGWSKGHMLHIFFQKKCVLSLVIALFQVDVNMDGSKRVLEPVQMAQCSEVDYEVEDKSSAAAAAAAPVIPKQPKKKPKTGPE